LDRNQILNQFNEKNEPMTIEAIRNLEYLAHAMVVDAGTRRSLSIFEKEAHPAGDTGPRKEALSVYAVLKRTQTSIGSRLLKLF
jgi:DNA mismatch repair ATPase MutS